MEKLCETLAQGYVSTRIVGERFGVAPMRLDEAFEASQVPGWSGAQSSATMPAMSYVPASTNEVSTLRGGEKISCADGAFATEGPFCEDGSTQRMGCAWAVLCSSRLLGSKRCLRKLVADF